MNIAEMTDQEKSVMLARLCGWRKEWTDNTSMVLLDADEKGLGYRLMRSGEAMPDLYDTENMALAWRVLNFGVRKWDENGYCWGWGINDVLDPALPPADAQRAWLDKVLTLAIEAGMVTK